MCRHLIINTPAIETNTKTESIVQVRTTRSVAHSGSACVQKLSRLRTRAKLGSSPPSKTPKAGCRSTSGRLAASTFKAEAPATWPTDFRLPIRARRGALALRHLGAKPLCQATHQARAFLDPVALGVVEHAPRSGFPPPGGPGGSFTPFFCVVSPLSVVGSVFAAPIVLCVSRPPEGEISTQTTQTNQESWLTSRISKRCSIPPHSGRLAGAREGLDILDEESISLSGISRRVSLSFSVQCVNCSRNLEPHRSATKLRKCV